MKPSERASIAVLKDIADRVGGFAIVQAEHGVLLMDIRMLLVEMNTRLGDHTTKTLQDVNQLGQDLKRVRQATQELEARTEKTEREGARLASEVEDVKLHVATLEGDPSPAGIPGVA
jgi:hypothetical protein